MGHVTSGAGRRLSLQTRAVCSTSQGQPDTWPCSPGGRLSARCWGPTRAACERGSPCARAGGLFCPLGIVPEGVRTRRQPFQAYGPQTPRVDPILVAGPEPRVSSRHRGAGQAPVSRAEAATSPQPRPSAASAVSACEAARASGHRPEGEAASLARRRFSGENTPTCPAFAPDFQGQAAVGREGPGEGRREVYSSVP